MDLSNQIIFQIIQTATLVVAVFVAWVSIKKQRETISLLMKGLAYDFLESGMRTLRHIHNSEDDDVAIYKQSEPFIIRLREQNKNPNLYTEFEKFIGILNA